MADFQTMMHRQRKYNKSGQDHDFAYPDLTAKFLQ